MDLQHAFRKGQAALLPNSDVYQKTSPMSMVRDAPHPLASDLALTLQTSVVIALKRLDGEALHIYMPSCSKRIRDLETVLGEEAREQKRAATRLGFCGRRRLRAVGASGLDAVLMPATHCSRTGSHP